MERRFVKRMVIIMEYRFTRENFNKEVIENLNCTHGSLLRMNRSIQSEGAFGSIKWNRSYKRLRRTGFEGVILEFGLICCGFNLHKYHLHRMNLLKAA